jgi:hypothetical protein
MFTKIKDYAYNQSSLWQIYAFSYSHSTILHILTEAGLLSLTALVLLFIQLLNSVNKRSYTYLVPVSLAIIMLFLPPSLSLFFAFFVLLGVIAQETKGEKNGESVLDVNNILPLYIGITLIPFVFICVSGFFLVKAYSAENYFKRSADSLTKQNIKDVYEYNRKAITTNPYIERFRLNFAQVNLLIAKNGVKLSTNTQDEKRLNYRQDKQTISQAIQAAISEAKCRNLKSISASNWANLASYIEHMD